MDFDFTTETITPDSTSILTIGGNGALELPVGTTAQEPSGAIAGAIRYNSSVPQLEYFNGTIWTSFGGTVTSVNLTAGSGVSVSGGPITSSGSITVTNTGVLSFSGGTTGLTPNTATTGAVVLAGTLNLASGGTNASLTAVPGAVVYSGATAMAFSGAGTAGQVLISGGTSSPTWTSSPTISGANITAASIPNSALANSSITVSAGTGVSVSGSPVSLGGTVTITNTGVTSNVAGTGITVSGATGAVTIGTANIPNSSLTNSSVTIGTTNIALGATATALTGITGITLVSGTVTGVATPVAGSDVVPLSYLQNVIAGLEWKQNAVAATTANLSTTYNNGTSGVGATLTATANGAISIDGYSPALNDRVLVKNQTTQTQNGIYTVTTVGTAGTPFVLTRATDANTSTELNNATLYITNGTTFANTAFTQTTANPVVGTGNVVFVQTAGSGTYSAGTGLTLTGSTFSITNVGTAGTYGSATQVPVFTTNAQGQVTAVTNTAITFPVTSVTGTGAGISVSPTTGAVVVSNTGVTSAVAGTGISVSGATGAVTFANTGVLSFSGGSTGLTPATATTGAVTLAGTLVAGNGGTGTSTAPTAGQLLVGVTGGTYTPFTVTTGTGISTTTGSGTFQINNTGVTSVAVTAGSLTTTGATGSITLNLATAGTAGTYGSVTTDSFGRVTAGSVIAAVANGGTGVATITQNGVVFGNGTAAVGSTAAGTTGQVLVGNTGAAPSFSTLSGIAVTSITGTANQITASAATGSVTLSTPSTFVAPGSIASTSTITAGTTLTISGNTANTFLYSGTAGLVSTTTAPTNGQLLIGSTGAAPVVGTITGSNNVTVTVGAGTIALSGPKYYAESSTAPTVAPSATGNQSIALGAGALSSKYGELTHAAGEFTSAGDAQAGQYILRIITTNATPAIAFLDGSAARLTLPANSAFMFDADIVAYRTDATGTSGAWNIKGLIKQDATVATTAIVGSTTKTFIAGANLVAGSVSATADNTNGALQFNVTGIAANTIRWVVTCRTTEVHA